MYQVKYFSFTDRVTGALSKGYGYSYDYIAQNVSLKLSSKGAVVNKNESVAERRDVFPREADLKEITKEEFDNLDTSGESFLSKISREKNFLLTKKLEKKLDVPVKALSNEQLIESFRK